MELKRPSMLNAFPPLSESLWLKYLTPEESHIMSFVSSTEREKVAKTATRCSLQTNNGKLCVAIAQKRDDNYQCMPFCEDHCTEILVRFLTMFYSTNRPLKFLIWTTGLAGVSKIVFELPLSYEHQQLWFEIYPEKKQELEVLMSSSSLLLSDLKKKGVMAATNPVATPNTNPKKINGPIAFKSSSGEWGISLAVKSNHITSMAKAICWILYNFATGVDIVSTKTNFLPANYPVILLTLDTIKTLLPTLPVMLRYDEQNAKIDQVWKSFPNYTLLPVNGNRPYD